MTRSFKKVDVPIGRVEFMGQVMHLAEHRGRLVGAMADESGQVVVVTRDEQVSAASCRRLLREGIDLLLNRAECVLATQAAEGFASETFPTPAYSKSFGTQVDPD